MMIDAGAKYLQSHEWIKQVEGNVYAVGLSAYAIEQLGDIVYMELPEAGAEYKKDESFGVVESVKSVSEMYTPISGKVVDVHSEVTDSPDILKTDTYGEGWLIRIEACNPTEFESLLDEAAYRKYLETEA